MLYQVSCLFTFGHIKLQIVSLGPERNMLELIGSGQCVADWNDDIGVVGVFVNLVSRCDSG